MIAIALVENSHLAFQKAICSFANGASSFFSEHYLRGSWQLSPRRRIVIRSVEELLAAEDFLFGV